MLINQLNQDKIPTSPFFVLYIYANLHAKFKSLALNFNDYGHDDITNSNSSLLNEPFKIGS